MSTEPKKKQVATWRIEKGWSGEFWTRLSPRMIRVESESETTGVQDRQNRRQRRGRVRFRGEWKEGSVRASYLLLA